MAEVPSRAKKDEQEEPGGLEEDQPKPLGRLRQVASTVRTLSPRKIRSTARQPVPFGVLATDESCSAQIHQFLRPAAGHPGAGTIVRIAEEDYF